MQRTIYGPDKEWLSDVEAAAFLNIRVELFNHLVKQGAIPRGTPFGHKIRRWPWEKIYATGVLLEHMAGLPETKPRRSKGQKPAEGT